MDKKAIDAWKEALGKMTYPQLLRAECKSTPGSAEWKKMFVAVPNIKEALRCALCETAIISKLTNIRQHISGKKHIRKMEQCVTTIRHPNINPLKQGATTVAAKPGNTNEQVPKTALQKPAQGNTKQPGVTQNAGKSSNQTQPVNNAASQNNPAQSSPKPGKQTPTAAKTVSQTQTTAKPVSQAQSTAKPENATQPVIQTQPAVKPVSQTQSTAKPVTPTESAAKPANQIQPTAKPVTQTQSTAKPVNKTQPTAKSVNPTQPVAKPVNPTQPAAKPVNPTQPAAKPVSQTQPTQKPTTQNNPTKTTISKPVLKTNQTQQNVAKKTADVANEDKQTPKAVIPSTEIKEPSANTSNSPTISKPLNASLQNPTKKEGAQNINISNQNKAISEAGPSKSSNENAPKHGDIRSIQKQKDQVKEITANNLNGNMSKDNSTNKSSTLVINPISVMTQKDLVKSGKHLKDIMKNFELKDLMVIEFRYSGFPWRPMFKKLPDGAFKCLLCGTYILKNFEDLKQHNDSIRHATSINAVEKLFHPNLAPTKEKEIGIDKKPTEKKDEKMDESEFRKLLPDLPLEEIQVVEYLVGKKWTPLVKEAANVITCNLCNANSILNYTALVDHLMSKVHLGNLYHVNNLFHPNLTLDKISLEKMNGISPTSQSATQNANVICIEDSPEKEIITTSSAKCEESKEKLPTVPDEEPKKVVNPAAIIAKSNKQITVIQKQDRIIPRSQYRPSQPIHDFNTMQPQFVAAPIQPSILPPIQTPDFISINQSEPMCMPSCAVPPVQHNEPQPTNITSHNQPRCNDPKFSVKDLTSKKIEEIDGFIGIEYVVKIVRNAHDDMPKYECCLCEIEHDGLGMQLHLKGLTHRRKFLERHFPTAMRQFARFKDNVSFISVMTQVCEKLAIAVEKYHGRDLPYECLDDEFRSNRDRIMSKVFSFRHASEHSGPSFVNVVDKKMLDEFIVNRRNKLPEPDTNRGITFDPRHSSSRKRRITSPPPLDVEQHKRLVERFLQNTSLPQGKRRSPHSRSPIRSHHHRRNSPKRSSSRKSFGSDEWDSYMRMFDHAVKDLDTDYDEYKKDPEKHPLYDEEWKKYWVKKSKSLRNVGIDPSTYNFQPGWVRFFSRRVHEMYDEAVEDIRKTLRERLGLPQHNDHLSDSKYHIGVHCVADRSNDDDDDLLEKEDLELARQQNESGDFSMDLPSELLDEDKNDDIIKMDTAEEKNEADVENETYNVVPVLRLLTALEDQLGSLGPKVNDLLSKALTLEKVKPNSSDENLITSENCVFLETVNEKLKGQVIAGMIVGNKLKAVKQAIRDLSGLLSMANNIIRNKPKVLEPPPPKDIRVVQKRPIKPSGSSEQPVKKQCLDKEEIATKLAAALAAQGKTDFSSEQLEQLVAVYTLIEKKQRETASNKKQEVLTEQQKSLSETLLDFLKPNAEEEPSKQQEPKPQSSHSFYSNSNNNPNSQMSFSSNMQKRPQPSSLLSDNFSQLRQFDTSLNISSLNRNIATSQSWGSSINTSFRQGSPYMNSNQNQSRQINSTGNNPYNFYQNQNNRGMFNVNEMSAPRNQGPNQSYMNEFNQRQLSNNMPVMTSNSMMRGTGSGYKNSSNVPMISYPQANQRGSNFPQNMMQKDQVQAPMGWQRNNAGRR